MTSDSGAGAPLTYSDDLWNGRDDLRELGVVLLGPRAYDPDLGRFLQRDPIIHTGGSDANPYSFAFDDPVNFADPSGLDGECVPCVDSSSLPPINYGTGGPKYQDPLQPRRRRRVGWRFASGARRGWSNGLGASADSAEPSMVEHSRVVGRLETGGESIPMKIQFPRRSFEFWQYRVSHGELLVRSPKDEVHPRNADLMFVGVEYVDLPRFLPTLEVCEAGDEDVARARERLGKMVERQHVLVLNSQGRRYLVVAAAAQVLESDMEIHDSPFD